MFHIIPQFFWDQKRSSIKEFKHSKQGGTEIGLEGALSPCSQVFTYLNHSRSNVEAPTKSLDASLAKLTSSEALQKYKVQFTDANRKQGCVFLMSPPHEEVP